jgi:hypothetical protein
MWAIEDRRREDWVMVSDSQSVQATLLEEERRLRHIDDHEEAVLIDITSGRVLWRKVGGAMGIGFDVFEIRQMAGNILSHNHPIGIRPPGGVFESTESRSHLRISACWLRQGWRNFAQ